jgi:hypothetical protein
MSNYEADLDGRCENCQEPIGFHGTHVPDQCLAALQERMREVVSLMKKSLIGPANQAEAREKMIQFLKTYGYVLGDDSP